MERISRIRLTLSGGATSSNDTREFSDNPEEPPSTSEIPVRTKRTLSNILHSPRRAFTRSKSRDRIYEPEPDFTLRKRDRGKLRKLKSEGFVVDPFSPDEIVHMESKKMVEKTAEGFMLRTRGVNSMPATNDDQLPLDPNWRFERRKNTRRKSQRRDEQINSLNQRIVSLEMENQKIKNERIELKKNMEALKKSNVAYLRRLKLAGISPNGSATSKTRSKGSRKESVTKQDFAFKSPLGNVSSYSDFVRGKDIQRTGDIVDSQMFDPTDISYVGRDTLESMCHSLQKDLAVVIAERDELKKIQQDSLDILVQLRATLDVISMPQHHKLSVKAETATIKQTSELVNKLQKVIDTRKNTKEKEPGKKLRKKKRSKVTIEAPPSPVVRRKSKRQRSASTFVQNTAVKKEKKRIMFRSNSEKQIADMSPSYAAMQMENLRTYARTLKQRSEDPPQEKLIFTVSAGDDKSILRSGEIFSIFEYVTERSHDPTDLEVFFINYREFVGAKELLLHIESRCNKNNWSPEIIRTSLQTLTYWTDEFPEDFQVVTVAEELEAFLQREELKEFNFKARMIRMQLRMCREKADSISELHNATVRSLKGYPEQLDIMSIQPIEFARQLTLFEFSMFQRIEPISLVTQKSRDSDECIKRMVQRFNRVSCWVATEILRVSNIKKRAAVLKYFILVAQACRELRNFNTLLEITAGLNLSVIQRLRKTWKLLPTKYITAFKNLEELMDCRANFIRYRQVLRASQLPCFPYFGIFLRDCAFIDVGNETLDENQYVNFEKLKLKADAIRLFQKFRKSAYHFPTNYSMQNFLQNLPAFDDSVLQKYSIQYERAAEI